MEEYKIIKGFENYEVSKKNVKNKKTEKILKPSINSNGYYHVNLYKDCKTFTKDIHRLVADVVLDNPLNKRCVDHKNNDKLDNNINNLRWATYQETNMNRKISIKNSSGYKGVHFDKKYNKWISRITINGKKQYLGLFDNIEEAVYARVKKAEELYGEYKNSCEKIININISHIENLNINIKIEANKDIEDLEIEQLEKELDEIINRK